jgi:MFS family permease
VGVVGDVHEDGEPVGGTRLAGRRARLESTGRAHYLGLAYTLAMMIIGTNLAAPLYPVWRARFGFSPLTITLVVALYVAALLPSLVFVGPLADTAGSRVVVLPALVLAAVGSLLFALAASTGWLFAARAAQGVAVGAAIGPLTAAIVAADPAGGGPGSVLAARMPTAGAGLGPLLGGALAQYAPWPTRLAFLAQLTLLAPGVVAVLAAPRVETAALAGPVAPGGWRSRLPQVPEGAGWVFALASLASLLAWAIAYVLLALVPSYLEAATGSHNLLLGGAAAGLPLVVAATTQAACARWDTGRAQRAGLAVQVVGLAGLVGVGVLAGRHGAATPSTPAAAGGTSLAATVLLLATVVVVGVGHGLATLGATVEVLALAPPDRRAGVASAFNVVTYLGAGFATIAVGLLTGSLGLVHAVQTAAIALAVVAVALLLLRRARA